ncbi:uncharacterized protein TRIADDRAFT_53746 [Trichoplax adhaerens]|uniref:UBA domain-containing protein n=1 Tax=Trichoplax adhaerens TaxID=10228 RepID=B3RQ20_TRIAD|nr:hypothetical protein TRIADDRAFT_53746 [Trichoplax adhaerens]EDV27744.1 hypothetical protein TRIADDRAFT_53746 [Trichoplax adhaerens]|eukprot:XP_002109578.1 hypothetical protein TRIADDRAFT_53746 [Trichoplax adhaerens]
MPKEGAVGLPHNPTVIKISPNSNDSHAERNIAEIQACLQMIRIERMRKQNCNAANNNTNSENGGTSSTQNLGLPDEYAKFFSRDCDGTGSPICQDPKGILELLGATSSKSFSHYEDIKDIDKIEILKKGHNSTKSLRDREYQRKTTKKERMDAITDAKQQAERQLNIRSDTVKKQVTKKAKPVVPIAKPKPKTKKQLKAEQKRREKEMAEIANKLEEKQKIDEEKAKVKKQREEEKQKLLMEQEKLQKKKSTTAKRSEIEEKSNIENKAAAVLTLEQNSKRNTKSNDYTKPNNESNTDKEPCKEEVDQLLANGNDINEDENKPSTSHLYKDPRNKKIPSQRYQANNSTQTTTTKKKTNYRNNYDNTAYRNNEGRNERYYYNDETANTNWNDERQDKTKNYNTSNLRDKGHNTVMTSKNNNDLRGRRVTQGFNNYCGSEDISVNKVKGDRKSNPQLTHSIRSGDNYPSPTENYNDRVGSSDKNTKTIYSNHPVNPYVKGHPERTTKVECDNNETDVDGWMVASSKKKGYKTSQPSQLANVDSQQLKTLIDMGFKRENANEALKLNHMDVEASVAYLLSRNYKDDKETASSTREDLSSSPTAFATEMQTEVNNKGHEPVNVISTDDESGMITEHQESSDAAENSKYVGVDPLEELSRSSVDSSANDYANISNTSSPQIATIVSKQPLRQVPVQQPQGLVPPEILALSQGVLQLQNMRQIILQQITQQQSGKATLTQQSQLHNLVIEIQRRQYTIMQWQISNQIPSPIIPQENQTGSLLPNTTMDMHLHEPVTRDVSLNNYAPNTNSTTRRDISINSSDNEQSQQFYSNSKTESRNFSHGVDDYQNVQKLKDNTSSTYLSSHDPNSQDTNVFNLPNINNLSGSRPNHSNTMNRREEKNALYSPLNSNANNNSNNNNNNNYNNTIRSPAMETQIGGSSHPEKLPTKSTRTLDVNDIPDNNIMDSSEGWYKDLSNNVNWTQTPPFDDDNTNATTATAQKMASILAKGEIRPFEPGTPWKPINEVTEEYFNADIHTINERTSNNNLEYSLSDQRMPMQGIQNDIKTSTIDNLQPGLHSWIENTRTTDSDNNNNKIASLPPGLSSAANPLSSHMSSNQIAATTNTSVKSKAQEWSSFPAVSNLMFSHNLNNLSSNEKDLENIWSNAEESMFPNDSNVKFGITNNDNKSKTQSGWPSSITQESSFTKESVVNIENNNLSSWPLDASQPSNFSSDLNIKPNKSSSNSIKSQSGWPLENENLSSEFISKPNVMPSLSILIKGFSSQVDENLLQALCLQHGRITEFVFDPRKRAVFVSYSSVDEAVRAQSRLNNCKIMDSTLEASFPLTKIPASNEPITPTESGHSLQWNHSSSANNNPPELSSSTNSTMAINSNYRVLNPNGSSLFPNTRKEAWSHTDSKPVRTVDDTKIFTPSSFLQGSPFYDQQQY